MINAQSIFVAFALVAANLVEAAEVKTVDGKPVLSFEVVKGRFVNKPIDHTLLDPNTGAMTVGFIKSLAPLRCAHLDIQQLNPKSSKAEDVKKVTDHLTGHHGGIIKMSDIAAAHTQAKADWDAARKVTPAPTPAP